ncbi:hypothetical protein J2S57_003415 [Kineosporia succinea]|uniref:Uncharacterized protein n=1 Tax=Kineosporia succinea TaxID=84632 RepID=A0ABT9P4N9_9ACTN|nr:hypothetical protein [Kineosporia succinea]
MGRREMWHGQGRCKSKVFGGRSGRKAWDANDVGVLSKGRKDRG